MTDSLWPDEGDRAPAGDPVAGDDPVAGRSSDPSVDDADDNAGDGAGDAGAEVDPLTALLAQIWEESKSRPVAVRVARPGEPPIPEPSPSVVSAPSPSDATPEDPPVPEPSPEPEPEPEPEATEDAAPPEPAIDGVGEPGPSGASNSAADAIDGAVISADRAAAPARDKITAEDSAAPAARSWRRRLVSRRMLFGLVPLLLVALAVALVVVGFRIIWGSRDGRLVTRITDSSAPGFEAIVEKTPTDLVLLVGADDSLIAASILAHGSDGTGGVIDVPVQTDVYIAPSPGAIVPVTIETLHRNSGVEPTRVALGELLNLEFDRVVVLDPAQLGALVAAAGSLTVNNPTEIATGRVVAFPKGSIALDGDGVIRYLTASAGTGDALAHSDRVQAFWKALIAASDPSGEVTSSGAGLESALGALAGSRVTFETLPVAQIDLPAGQEAQYRLAPGVSGPQAIASVVPLPEGAPGRRPRLKVIDGTGEFDAARGPAILLAAAGAQIDIVGNAPSFDVDTTQIVYYDPAEKDDAERLRSVLGVGEVVQSTQSNSALDLTITIGADYRDRSTTSGAGGG